MKSEVKSHTERIISLLALTALIGLAAPASFAVDWPQYRGPNHDGVSVEKIRTNWSEKPPQRLWQVALMPGLSSFSIAGGRAFTQVRRRIGTENQEVCIALNADTGAELWAVPLGIADYPNGGVGADDGPRSTPTIDGDRVYVFTSYLRLACLNAANGQIIWSRNFVTELGSTVVQWQNAASPLLVGDLIFVNSNAGNQRLMAVKKFDGTTVWRGQSDVMTQATPIAATIAGVPQVIFFAQSGLVSVSPSNGAVFWRYAFPFSTSTAASPVVAGDLVYCSAAYGGGAGMVRVAKSGAGATATQVWRTPGANMNHWATPVHHDGYLYGVYGQSTLTLRCINASTGADKWRQGGVGYGSVLFVSGHLLVFTATGDLVLVKPNPEAYEEVGRFKAVTGKCWNVAAISNGRIYARSTTEAAAYDVSLPVLPKLRITSSVAPETKRFQLLISNEDGSPLDATRAASIDLIATSDATLASDAWTRIAVPSVLTNGALRFDDSLLSVGSVRYFRTSEQR